MFPGAGWGGRRHCVSLTTGLWPHPAPALWWSWGGCRACRPVFGVHPLFLVAGFSSEHAPYALHPQPPTFPKGGLLDSLCAPSALAPESDFPVFPKSRLSTVSVSYCPAGQDFAASSLSLLPSGTGKAGARLCLSTVHPAESSWAQDEGLEESKEPFVEGASRGAGGQHGAGPGMDAPGAELVNAASRSFL